MESQDCQTLQLTAYSATSSAIYRCGLKALQTIAQVFQAGFAVQITVVSICAVSLIYLFYAAYKRADFQAVANTVASREEANTVTSREEANTVTSREEANTVTSREEQLLQKQTFLKGLGAWSDSQCSLDSEKKCLMPTERWSTWTTLESCCNREGHELNLSRWALPSVPDLSALTSLRSLNLSENKLKVVPGLSALTNLEELNLSENKLKVVPGLSALTSLKWLYLCNNQLAGELDLSALTSLQLLTLSNNSFNIEVIDDCVTNLRPGISGLRVYFTDYYPLSKDCTVKDDGRFISANGVHFYFARPMQSK